MPHVVSNIKRRRTFQQLSKLAQPTTDNNFTGRQSRKSNCLRNTNPFLSKSEQNLSRNQNTDDIELGWSKCKTDPVSKWLSELRQMGETECLCILQAKSLSKMSDKVDSMPKSTDTSNTVSQSVFRPSTDKKDIFKQSMRIQG
jgi:hypothetical protein